jgi:hypothetical protein
MRCEKSSPAAGVGTAVAAGVGVRLTIEGVTVAPPIAGVLVACGTAEPNGVAVCPPEDEVAVGLLAWPDGVAVPLVSCVHAARNRAVSTPATMKIARPIFKIMVPAVPVTSLRSGTEYCRSAGVRRKP